MGDFVVIAMSPVFIALLVGSLVFFLLDVFYQGEMEYGIRWMMFWYVIAIVAVARISVDRGPMIANVYGLALAVTTWLYISSTHQGFMLGIILLAFIWWCAHRLVVDCSDSESSSPDKTSTSASDGILGQWMPRQFKIQQNSEKKQSRQAGLWVVYFSMAAVPLFGIGKVLLPASDTHLKSRAGLWLCIYLISALFLLISTRFLNLRQTLRDRGKKMPSQMAFQWFLSGIWLVLIVGFLAWLTPRPGSAQQWVKFSNTVNTRIREASDWAMQWNPKGTGEGKEGEQADQGGDSLAQGMEGDEGDQGQQNPQEAGPKGQPNSTNQDGSSTSQSTSNPIATNSGAFHWLFWMAAICVIVWILYRNRSLLTTLMKEWWAACCLWLKQFGFQNRRKKGTHHKNSAAEKPQLQFKDFKNPFTHAKAQAWGDTEIIHYTMDAFQAWLQDHQSKPLASDTPIEQLQQWSLQYPDAYGVLHYLYSQHTHAGFGKGPRTDFKKEPLKELWSWMQST